ncbi:MAG TPA: GNAT family N-acetyltransferase [Verrucomicrobiae bacterium]|nr:GNAT family N-acetyltransferase [Verrucomicrobiae bacterium]
MNPRIVEPSSDAEAELNSFLDARIYEFNVRSTGCGDGRAFSSTIKDDSGEIVAAINGHTWGGCCHILHLWVHELKRRQGIGRALLQAVEDEAIRRGCAQSLVVTHSFQAPAFYERYGYVRQASIPDYPQGHAQHVYLKQLGR